MAYTSRASSALVRRNPTPLNNAALTRLSGRMSARRSMPGWSLQNSRMESSSSGLESRRPRKAGFRLMLTVACASPTSNRHIPMLSPSLSPISRIRCPDESVLLNQSSCWAHDTSPVEPDALREAGSFLHSQIRRLSLAEATRMTSTELSLPSKPPRLRFD